MPEYFPQDDSTYPLQVKKITVEDDVNPANANAAPEALSKRTDYLNTQLILLADQLSNISFDGYTKSESDQLLADLIDGAPDALNTLNELAAALNENDSELAALLAAINIRLTQVQVQEMIISALAVPTLTGTATFTNVENNVALVGIGSIGLEVGDVVTFAGSVNNNSEFTVEVITDDDNVIFNEAHAGGTTSKSLIDETADLTTVTLLSKWHNAPIGLGQGWVDVLTDRLENVTYNKPSKRAMSVVISAKEDRTGVNTVVLNLFIDNEFIVRGGGQYVDEPIISIPITGLSDYEITMSGLDSLQHWKELR
jgi:hypothetical protein